MIVRVSVVLSLRRTVVGNGDWRFDNLSGGHSQSQVKGCCQSNDLHPKLYNYTYPDDQTTLLHVTREFKPFTVNNCWYYTNILHSVIFSHLFRTVSPVQRFSIVVTLYCIRAFLNQLLKMYRYGSFLRTFTGLLWMFFGMLLLVFCWCFVLLHFIHLTL